MCNKEIAHAVKNGKRILPVFIHNVEDKEIYGISRELLNEKTKVEINRRNFIFCRPGRDDFKKAIEETRKTIHTDYEWLKYHTRLQVKALEWERRKEPKDTSQLLRGKELREAEQRLAEVGAQKDPQPTDLQRQYILASQRNEIRTRRQITFGLAIGLVITIVLSFVAWGQRNNALNSEATAIAEAKSRATAQAVAEVERDRADENAKISLARQLSAQSGNLINSNYDLGVLLAVQANKLVDLPETQLALSNAIEYEPLLERKLLLPGVDPDKFLKSEMAISPDGTLLAVTVQTADNPSINYSCYDTDLFLLNSDNGEVLFQTRYSKSYVAALNFHPQGDLLGLSVINCNDFDSGHYALWSIATRSVTKQFKHYGRSLIFLDNGKTMITGGFDQRILFWDLETGNITNTLLGHDNSINAIAVSPDEKILASGGEDGKVFVWNLTTYKLTDNPLSVLPHAITDLVISADRRYLALSSSTRDAMDSVSGLTMVWDFQLQKIVYKREASGSLLDLHNQSSFGLYEFPTFALNILNFATGDLEREIKGVVNLSSVEPGTMVASSDGKVIFANYANMLVIWNTNQEHQTGVKIATVGEYPRIAVEPYNNLVAFVGESSRIVVLDLKTGNVKKTLESDLDKIRSIVVKPNSYILVAFGTRFQGGILEHRNGGDFQSNKGYFKSYCWSI